MIYNWFWYFNFCKFGGPSRTLEYLNNVSCSDFRIRNSWFDQVYIVFFQMCFALLVIAVCVVSAYATEESRQSSQSTAATGDRNKRGLYASPYLAPYGASPYVASPYAASPYVASPYVAPRYVASPYVASPYAASPRYVSSPYVSSHHPYGAVSSYATYPYVAKTFASPYAYYPWEDGIAPRCILRTMHREPD